jgi:uncharacterized membrane protein
MAQLRYLILSVLLIALPACSANIPSAHQQQAFAAESLSNRASAATSAGLDHKIYCETKTVTSTEGTRRTEWCAEIDAPPQKVWAILTNYENYPNLIPSATSYKVVERNGNSLKIETKGHYVKDLEGFARYTEDPAAFTVKWQKITGNTNLNSGFWELKPFEHNGRIATHVFHYVYTAPNLLERIGGMVGKLEQDETTMITRIKEMAEKQ